jgi:hypothetical protein
VSDYGPCEKCPTGRMYIDEAERAVDAVCDTCGYAEKAHCCDDCAYGPLPLDADALPDFVSVEPVPLTQSIPLDVLAAQMDTLRAL